MKYVITVLVTEPRQIVLESDAPPVAFSDGVCTITTDTGPAMIIPSSSFVRCDQIDESKIVAPNGVPAGPHRA